MAIINFVLMISITEASSCPSSPARHLDLHHSVVVVSLMLLPQLSLPLSDKVKQLHGDCIAYNKATTIRLLPVADNFTKHDHLIQQCISHHVLTISHHNKPYKNKLDVLYFVVANFTLLRASSKNCSYLRIKTTTIFHQVCCFNLQQGPAVVKLDSTKVGETDTRQPPLCKARWENQSHERGHVVSVRAASSNNTAESKKDVGGKQYDYYRPQLFVFYSCI